jgi:cytochrome c oxidase subunit 2
MWKLSWNNNLPLLPERASTIAGHVDALFWFLVLVTIFFTGLVMGMVIIFSMRYRKDRNPVATQIEGSIALEAFWTLVPLGIAMVIFVWAALLYFRMFVPPTDSMEVYVVGKQWMWKVEHPSGAREINQLHVPMGRNVRLTMISQDVIHDFSIPDFRVKHDVLPGRYTTLWFQATKAGTYHLLCQQYCGTLHSEMVGQVIVLEPAQYEAWLSGGSGGGSLASGGEKLFASLGCITCHTGEAGARGPNLAGIYGHAQTLSNGQVITVDDNYIRESVLNPTAKIVAGFQPIMPTFSGQISEEGLIQIIAYIKSLQSPEAQAQKGTGATAGATTLPPPKQKTAGKQTQQ